MRYAIPLFLLFFSGMYLEGQVVFKSLEGKVSYVTAQNVYVKFESTEKISRGDTLFTKQDSALVPALIVKDISSISCVCLPLSSKKFTVSDQIFTRPKLSEPEQVTEPPAGTPPLPAAVYKEDSVPKQITKSQSRAQSIDGRFSISSYLNFSSEAANSQRMRYTFSFNAQNIGNSKLSAETYISFVHKLGEWSEIQNDVFNGLKIYSLALKYEFNRNNTIWLGRKINPRISNVGAIDGVQYELRIKSFTVGLVGGFRPDFKNYNFNPDLVQFGGYLGHDYANKKGSMQTTLAFMQQNNTGNTDRRFAYLQHTNSLISGLFFFGSVELDLYNMVFDSQDSILKKDNSPSLTNLYLSLRYRPVRQLSFSLSYSNRQNVIYYETYKDIVERLLEETALQGITFQVNYQPVKKLSLGLNLGYRDNVKDPSPSKNLYGYVTYSQVPGLNISTTISVTLLETSYISGQIYSLGISRDLVSGKVYLGFNYRYVNYNFASAESKLVQNMGEMYITWRILKKLSCSLNYEGTFEKSNTFNRVYINLTQRF